MRVKRPKGEEKKNKRLELARQRKKNTSKDKDGRAQCGAAWLLVWDPASMPVNPVFTHSATAPPSQ